MLAFLLGGALARKAADISEHLKSLGIKNATCKNGFFDDFNPGGLRGDGNGEHRYKLKLVVGYESYDENDSNANKTYRYRERVITEADAILHERFGIGLKIVRLVTPPKEWTCRKWKTWIRKQLNKTDNETEKPRRAASWVTFGGDCTNKAVGTLGARFPWMNLEYTEGKTKNIYNSSFQLAAQIGYQIECHEECPKSISTDYLQQDGEKICRNLLKLFQGKQHDQLPKEDIFYRNETLPVTTEPPVQAQVAATTGPTTDASPVTTSASTVTTTSTVETATEGDVTSEATETVNQPEESTVTTSPQIVTVAVVPATEVLLVEEEIADYDYDYEDYDDEEEEGIHAEAAEFPSVVPVADEETSPLVAVAIAIAGVICLVVLCCVVGFAWSKKHREEKKEDEVPIHSLQKSEIGSPRLRSEFTSPRSHRQSEFFSPRNKPGEFTSPRTRRDLEYSSPLGKKSGEFTSPRSEFTASRVKTGELLRQATAQGQLTKGRAKK